MAAILMRLVRPLRTAWGLVFVGVAIGLAVNVQDTLSLLLVVSLAFLWVCVPLSSSQQRRINPARRWRWALLGIGLLTIAFVVLKVLPQLGEIHNSFVAMQLGLNMLLYLRIASFLWEIGAGRISRPSTSHFFGWSLLPFTRFGPILRFSEWERQKYGVAAVMPTIDSAWWQQCGCAIGKLILGAMLPVLGQILQERYGRAGLLIVLYTTSPWSWYLNAAGLADIAILSGYLCGITIPPNYARPFESRNLGEFWARWNMTATAIFRETLFYNRWGLTVPNLYLNSMIVFVLVGLWHDINAYWILWGLLHGVGFCAFIAWKQWRGADAKPLPRMLSWAITYLFVCSCWALPPQLMKWAGRLAVW